MQKQTSHIPVMPGKEKILFLFHKLKIKTQLPDQPSELGSFK